MSSDGERPPIVDGHVDSLLAASPDTQFDRADGTGDVDLPGLRVGGVAAAFFAAFVPAADTASASDIATQPPEIDPAHARRETHAMLDRLDSWIDAGHLRRVTEPADLDRAIEDARRVDRSDGDDDPVGAITHLEGAAAIRPDLSNLDAFYERGVRSIGLVWSRPNAFGYGVPFTHDDTPDTGPGLTDAGERLVEACVDRGILVDCAHATAAGVRDVARLASQPLVVSHAGCHAVSPAARNLTDELLELVARENGLVGISFAASHLRPDGERDPDVPLSLLLDHVDHAVRVAGIDHVALGTDFDGARVLDPVSGPHEFDRLRAGLRERGYTPGEIGKIAHGNWARVVRAWL